VRCIVRREDAIATIKGGPSLQQYADRVEFAVVTDNTASGSYDAALAGARYVVHIAGVWPKPNYHPDHDIYYPFVKSMENILSAAEKAGTVRRIVFTQAGAALVNPDDGDTLGTAMEKVLNGKWAKPSPLERLPADRMEEHTPVNAASAAFRPPLATPHHAYCGAKAYCMTYLKSLRAAAQLPYSIVQVLPGTVIGPSELIVSALDAAARMDRMSRALLFDDPKPRYAFGFVHVDDCAAVHIEALNEDKVPDSELPDWYIAAAPSPPGKSGSEIWRETGDVVEQEFGQEIKCGMVTVGRKNVPINMPYCVESRLTERLLLGGRNFRGLAACVTETGHWYRNLVAQEDRK